MKVRALNVKKELSVLKKKGGGTNYLLTYGNIIQYLIPEQNWWFNPKLIPEQPDWCNTDTNLGKYSNFHFELVLPSKSSSKIATFILAYSFLLTL
jgi:hypothetical protein